MDDNLTATTPHVKQLIVKHAATQTQPYPPSGGLGTAGDGSSISSASRKVLHVVLIVMYAREYTTDRDNRSQLIRRRVG